MKKAFILLILTFFLTLPARNINLAQVAQARQESGYSIEGWVFGDVVELDSENNQFILSYVNYNNEEEEIAILVDAKTKYKNVNGLGDIKIDDAVSVDYKVSPEGKVIALALSVEKIKGEE